jgi:hypothetical protein
MWGWVLSGLCLRLLGLGVTISEKVRGPSATYLTDTHALLHRQPDLCASTHIAPSSQEAKVTSQSRYCGGRVRCIVRRVVVVAVFVVGRRRADNARRMWSESVQTSTLCQHRWCSWPWLQRQGRPLGTIVTVIVAVGHETAESSHRSAPERSQKRGNSPTWAQRVRGVAAMPSLRQEVRVLVGPGATRHTSRVSVMM